MCHLYTSLFNTCVCTSCVARFTLAMSILHLSSDFPLQMCVSKSLLLCSAYLVKVVTHPDTRLKHMCVSTSLVCLHYSCVSVDDCSALHVSIFTSACEHRLTLLHLCWGWGHIKHEQYSSTLQGLFHGISCFNQSLLHGLFLLFKTFSLVHNIIS